MRGSGRRGVGFWRVLYYSNINLTLINSETKTKIGVFFRTMCTSFRYAQEISELLRERFDPLQVLPHCARHGDKFSYQFILYFFVRMYVLAILIQRLLLTYLLYKLSKITDKQ